MLVIKATKAGCLFIFMHTSGVFVLHWTFPLSSDWTDVYHVKALMALR